PRRGPPGPSPGHAKDLLPPVARPPAVVELVAEPAEPSRRALSVVLLVVRGVADAGRERDPRPVGRPRELARVLLEVGELLGLASVEREDVDLARGLLSAAPGDEREPAAVRRPARLRVALLPRRQPARRRRSVDGREPDGASVLPILSVDPPDDVRNPIPVRVQARIAHAGEREYVLGDHSRHGDAD